MNEQRKASLAHCLFVGTAIFLPLQNWDRVTIVFQTLLKVCNLF